MQNGQLENELSKLRTASNAEIRELREQLEEMEGLKAALDNQLCAKEARLSTLDDEMRRAQAESEELLRAERERRVQLEERVEIMECEDRKLVAVREKLEQDNARLSVALDSVRTELAMVRDTSQAELAEIRSSREDALLRLKASLSTCDELKTTGDSLQQALDAATHKLNEEAEEKARAVAALEQRVKNEANDCAQLRMQLNEALLRHEQAAEHGRLELEKSVRRLRDMEVELTLRQGQLDAGEEREAEKARRIETLVHANSELKDELERTKKAYGFIFYFLFTDFNTIQILN